MLRNYGLFEAWTLDGAPGYIWVQDGNVIGNASVQRNAMRRDTWIIGNVATHPDHRNRGIAGQLIQACIDHATRRRASHVALQVTLGNENATRLYRQMGFVDTGTVVHYRRPSLRMQPLGKNDPWANPCVMAGGAHRKKIVAWAGFAVPPGVTYADTVDPAQYELGWAWTLRNILGGSPERWWIAGTDAANLAGAARTRVNNDGPEHHLELILGPNADARDANALVRAGLLRLQDRVSKPIYAAQARPHPIAHQALKTHGFEVLRELVHMQLNLP
jgi:hypothetical protein